MILPALFFCSVLSRLFRAFLLLWRCLKKLKIELPYDPAIPFLGLYQKECKSCYTKGTCTTMFTAALFTKPKLSKQSRCPTTNEWIKKIWYYIQWNFIQPQRAMKFCHFQVSEWSWRTSS
jgi:hypothetical protein